MRESRLQREDSWMQLKREGRKLMLLEKRCITEEIREGKYDMVTPGRIGSSRKKEEEELHSIKVTTAK